MVPKLRHEPNLLLDKGHIHSSNCLTRLRWIYIGSKPICHRHHLSKRAISKNRSYDNFHRRGLLNILRNLESFVLFSSPSQMSYKPFQHFQAQVLVLIMRKIIRSIKKLVTSHWLFRNAFYIIVSKMFIPFVVTGSTLG